MKLSTALRRAAADALQGGFYFDPTEAAFMVRHLGKRIWAEWDMNRWCLMLLLLAEIAEGEER